jgi:hypothetical protein
MSKRLIILPALLLALALGGGTLLANTSFAPAISRWVVAGGGSSGSGGGFTLNATVGQHEAGATLSGGGFTLTSGFWGQAGARQGGTVHLPLVQR